MNQNYNYCQPSQNIDGPAMNDHVNLKVIKGEIHNVLSVMRADPQYASPSRFSSESSTYNATNLYPPHGQHPLIASLRDLNEFLTLWEINRIQNSKSTDAETTTSSAASTSSTSFCSITTAPPTIRKQLDAITYLSPFCTAISSRDISAPITGAALDSLQKFLLYGFIDPCAVHDAKEGLTIVARAIQHCCFEESGGINSNPSSMSSLLSAGTAIGIVYRNTNTSPVTTNKTSLRISDEEVVLKLLSLASLVIRSSLLSSGTTILNAEDVVGIFDTCLHVATRVGDRSSGLLQSAASDCLGGIVLVVFGRSVAVTAGCLEVPSVGGIVRVDGITGLVGYRQNGDRDDCDDSQGSDDLWGESDPSEPGQHEIHGDYKTNTNIKGAASVTNSIDTQYGVKTNASGQGFVKDRENVCSRTQSQASPSSQKDPQSLTQMLEKQVSTKAKINTTKETESLPAHVTIMSRLASLANPLTHCDQTCTTALQLINIALETASSEFLVVHSQLLNILQNTLCKHLLYLSTTSDLVILSQTLRVIFNLFNSIKHHLKVQLEVFLTSVHLRILDSSSKDGFTSEQKEIALESLLEFCNEPSLMHDIYVNYDCDVQCTNLFDTICRVLASVATGSKLTDHKEQQHSIEIDNTVKSREEIECSKDFFDDMTSRQPFNVLNELACEGILAVIDSISRRCEPHSHDENISTCVNSPDKGMKKLISGDEESSVTTNSTNLSYTDATESIGSIIDIASPPSTRSASLEWLDDARKQTSKVFSERKRKKRHLSIVVKKFNSKPFGKEWIREGVELEIFVEPVMPRSIAQFLRSAPNLDKTQIGEYISKGPPEKYPFHSVVLHEFLSLFHFGGVPFSDALRLFLKTFRLPGEAQCIDRLMDAFAARLYLTQTTSNFDSDEQKENNHNMSLRARRSPSDKGTDLSPIKSRTLHDMYEDATENVDAKDNLSADDDEGGNPKLPQDIKNRKKNISPFRNADAAFVLAFSTIMLNTDLHNPTIKDEKRMTLEQFIHNNRGINDGHDFPTDFMTDLYFQIKNQEIQVKKDISDVINGGIGSVHHLSLLLSTSEEKFTPFFTSHDKSRCVNGQASVHESDMFISIAPCALKTLTSIFISSSDGSLVTKLLTGFEQMAKICIYFELDSMFNQILKTQLEYGKEYINHTVFLVFCGCDVDEFSEMDEKRLSAGALSQNHHGTESAPAELALSNKFHANKSSQYSYMKNNLIAGSASHKGLLSLDCSLQLVKSHLTFVQEAWPSLLECIFALRDSNALPVGFSKLDDFSDSSGKILPPSQYALHCRSKVNKYMTSKMPNDKKANLKGSVFWPFSTLISKIRTHGTLDDDGFSESNPLEPSGSDFTEDSCLNYLSSNLLSFSNVLLSMTEAAKINEIFNGEMEKKTASNIFHALIDVTLRNEANCDIPIDQRYCDFNEDLIFEHRAVFALELAARLMFSNRDYAHELFPLLMRRFEAILEFCVNDTDGQDQLQHPFLIERYMITVLRSCIHMVDLLEMRLYIFKALSLIIELPPTFLSHVSDRLACGMSIIIFHSYSHLKEVNEWVTIGDLLDCCAQYETGRQYIFNGIASCIDKALPAPYVDGNVTQICTKGVSKNFDITYEAASMFARLLLKFVFGSYNGDLSLSVLAIPCLEKVYWYLHFMTIDISVDSDNGGRLIPDEDLWRSVCSAFYSIGLCDTPNSAIYGMDCLERLIVSTEITSVSDAGWLGLLESITSKQPCKSQETVRIRAFNLLCRTLLSVLPHLVKRKDNRGALTEIVGLAAGYANENFRHGRMSLLFENTIEALTNTINVMTTKEFVGGSAFLSGLTEILFNELEKVGGVGGLTQMVAFTSKRLLESEVRLTGINHCL